MPREKNGRLRLFWPAGDSPSPAVSITVGAGGANRSGYNRILELSAKFDAIGSRAGDMTAPLTRVGEDLHTQMAAAFATEGATGVSGPWTQLSETYGSVPILVGAPT